MWPNASAVNQELDQMFGYHKKLLRQARREMADAREDDRKREMQEWLARQGMKTLGNFQPLESSSIVLSRGPTSPQHIRRFRRCTSTLRGWRLARTLARAKT